jgi:hypothetical protein
VHYDRLLQLLRQGQRCAVADIDFCDSDAGSRPRPRLVHSSRRSIPACCPIMLCRYGRILRGVSLRLVHFSHHPASLLAMFPFYVAVSAVYGGLAYATNSILPGLVLHAGGDVFSLTRLWMTGLPEWRISAATPSLIWELTPHSLVRQLRLCCSVVAPYGHTGLW